MDNNFNLSDKQIENLKRIAKQKTGLDINSMASAAKNGSLDSFLSKNMDSNCAEKVKQLLVDKEKAQKVLNTPEAQALIKKLLG